MVHFKLDGQDLETLDSVRYRALLAYVDTLGPASGDWSRLRAIGTSSEIDGPGILEELDHLARRGVPEDLAPMIGNVRNDVLRSLRTQGKLGPEE